MQGDKKKHTNKTESRGVVTRRHTKINRPAKPHTKLRQVLVHPKDKIKQNSKCNVIYEIPCLSCNKTYIGETRRRDMKDTWKKEHQKECEKEAEKRQTRSIKEKEQQENRKTAPAKGKIMSWTGTRPESSALKTTGTSAGLGKRSRYEQGWGDIFALAHLEQRPGGANGQWEAWLFYQKLTGWSHLHNVM